MIKSMTGFGREHIVANGREIIVEIRSLQIWTDFLKARLWTKTTKMHIPC